MNGKSSRGGPREGAGRNRRTDAEKWRVKLWYETVSGFLAGEMVPGRKLGDIVLEAGERHKLPSATQKTLGSQEAWRWYQGGERTPKSATLKAVDLVLEKQGYPPVGWILTPAGQMQLSPVWFWPSSECVYGKDRIKRCAEMERKFWKRLPGNGTLTVDAVHCGIIGFSTFEAGEEEPGGAAWPPRTLVPTEVADTLPREDGAPFPHLFPRKEDICSEIPEDDLGLYHTEKDLMEKYQAWAASSVAAEEDGEIWFYHLRCLPGSPFYRPDLASVEIDGLRAWRDRILENEIREYFGLPRNNSPLI